MRASVLMIVLAACAMRPAPKLPALPGEPERRDVALETAPVRQEQAIRKAVPAALEIDQQAPPPRYDQSLVPWVKLK